MSTKPAPVRAIVIPVGRDKSFSVAGGGGGKAKPGDSQQPIDPFDQINGQYVEPRYDPRTLTRYVENSSELPQCIAAMETGIESYGHRYVEAFDSSLFEGPDGEDVKRLVRDERKCLENTFSTLGRRRSFTKVLRLRRRDLESTGNGYLEVMRGRSGRIVALDWMRSADVRIGVADEQPTSVQVKYRQIGPDGHPYWEMRDETRYFRRYVMGTVSGGRGRLRWFKEIGDPRVVDVETGKVVSDEEQHNWLGQPGVAMPEGRKANECWHVRIESPRDPVYGVPRWVGGTVNVLGMREAQEVNYETIGGNNIPSIFILVSGGRINQESVNRLKEAAETALQNVDRNRSKFIVLEAEGLADSDESGKARIEVKPMTKEQFNDSLFGNYIKAVEAAIRRAFRLPGILVGYTDDITKNVSETSIRLADEQVFAPERTESDWEINALLLPDFGILWWKVRSRTPNVTDNSELVQLAAVAERTGGMTPRIGRQLITDVFEDSLNVPPLDPEKFDPDVPFSLTMAEAVQNRAQPTEVGQQIAPVQPAAETGKIAAAAAKTLGDELLRDVGTYGDVLSILLAARRPRDDD